jgi:carbon storage regulator
MLVLSRKQGESIQIGDDITIIIVDTTDNRAKVAIDAPVGVKIRRTRVEERDEQRSRKTRWFDGEHRGKVCQ